MTVPVPIAVLMCHAPIVVPAVGGARGTACVATTAAMRAVAARLVAARPDALVVVSPHTPRAERAFGVLGGDRLRGDFGAFGAPGARVDLPPAPEVRQALLATGLAAPLAERPLDHGASVPLWFVQEAGWSGPTAVLALPWTEGGEAATGEALARAAAGARWAVLASGDMSHRLRPGAPSGFHPRAADFDAAFVARIRAGDLRGAVAVDPGLREVAAEDVVASVALAAGAVGFRSDGHELLAYEGPFGVGYCEAVLYEEAA